MRDGPRDRLAFRTPALRRMVVGGHQVDLLVRRSPRARLLRLIVRPAEPPELVLPRWAALAEVEPFLDENRQWLEDKLAWARSLSARPPVFALDRAGVVWLHGMAIPIVSRESGRTSANLVAGRLVVAGTDPLRAVDLWYRRTARSELTRCATHEAHRLGLRFRSISIRDARTRWGSCTSRGDLSFSWRLVLAPRRVGRHVVIHELCHLRNQNHGTAFRRAMQAASPDWLESDRWLSDHGHDLRRYVPRLGDAFPA